jgi:hypothetical protein
MTRSGITAKIGRLEDGRYLPSTPTKCKMNEAQLVRQLNFPASAAEHPLRSSLRSRSCFPASEVAGKMLKAEDCQGSGSGAAPYRPCRHTS